MTACGKEAQVYETLRHMLAVLEAERQALAGLDLDAIVGTTRDKDRLCAILDGNAPLELDDECRSLLEMARRLNAVNRQVRNIIAANVATRLNILTGTPRLYRAGVRTSLAAGRG